MQIATLHHPDNSGAAAILALAACILSLMLIFAVVIPREESRREAVLSTGDLIKQEVTAFLDDEISGQTAMDLHRLSSAIGAAVKRGNDRALRAAQWEPDAVAKTTDAIWSEVRDVLFDLQLKPWRQRQEADIARALEFAVDNGVRRSVNGHEQASAFASGHRVPRQEVMKAQGLKE